MAVKVLALSTVFEEPMSCAKLDAPHNSQTHIEEVLIFCAV
jgi:hypothetical protein